MKTFIEKKISIPTKVILAVFIVVLLLGIIDTILKPQECETQACMPKHNNSLQGLNNYFYLIFHIVLVILCLYITLKKQLKLKRNIYSVCREVTQLQDTKFFQFITWAIGIGMLWAGINIFLDGIVCIGSRYGSSCLYEGTGVTAYSSSIKFCMIGIFLLYFNMKKLVSKFHLF